MMVLRRNAEICRPPHRVGKGVLQPESNEIINHLFGKVQLGKIQFGKIHFEKIQFGKYSFRKLLSHQILGQNVVCFYVTHT